MILQALTCPKYDRGPNCNWERVSKAAPLAYYRTHPSGSFKTSFNAVFYRGRLDGSARILIIGQDPSTDESVASRAFVGTVGQRLQHFLSKIGITKSYLIVNTFIYGNTESATNLRTYSAEAPIATFRNKVLDKNKAFFLMKSAITLYEF